MCMAAGCESSWAKINGAPADVLFRVEKSVQVELALVDKEEECGGVSSVQTDGEEESWKDVQGQKMRG